MGNEVEVLGETYEPGKPEGEEQGALATESLLTRDEKLRYWKLVERYWYGKEMVAKSENTSLKETSSKTIPKITV